MVGDKASTALAAVQALNAEAGAPEWIMLLPPGRVVQTIDGRGPYRVDDLAKLATDSLQAAGGMLPIDENHSTDLAAPKGGPSPARGWIVVLEARPAGLFGKVEWTAGGKQLLAERAYRGISPVIMHAKDGRVLSIPRASLTNVPNLRGMAALHSEESQMEEFMKSLRDALGLPADADQAAIIAAAKASKSSIATQAALAPIAKAAGLKDDADAVTVLAAVTTLKSSTALSAALAPIAKAAGLKEDAEQPAIVAAVTSLAAKGGTAVAALQAELATVTTALNSMKADGAKDKATAFVDGAIKAGRVGVKPMRDHYIAMHALDAARVEKEINAMPILGGTNTSLAPPAKDKDGKIALNAEQSSAAKLLGVSEEDYAKTLAAEAKEEEAA